MSDEPRKFFGYTVSSAFYKITQMNATETDFRLTLFLFSIAIEPIKHVNS